MFRLPLPPLTSLACWALVPILAGCAGSSIPRGQVQETFSQQQGRTVQQYLYLGTSEPEPFNWRYRMLAAAEFRRLGRIRWARQMLEDIDPRHLDDEYYLAWSLQTADLMLENEQLEEALRLLYSDRLSGILQNAERDRQLQAELLLARAHVLNRQPVSAFFAAVRAASGLEVGGDESLQLQLAMWEMLTDTSRKRLQSALQAPEASSAVVRGWLELAALCRDYDADSAALGFALADWERRYPAHPAPLDRLPEIRLLSTEASLLPERIAMLLPLSGPFAEAGHALRDGFLAAWYQAREQGQAVPEVLEFVDTGRADIGDLLKTLEEQAVQLIVGPLLRENIAALVAARPQLPVLTLNYSDARNLPKTVNQFGLNAEDELTQLVSLAVSREWRSAMVIRQDQEWTERASQSFGAAWQQAGGVLADDVVYANARDISRSVASALGLRNSRRRRVGLEKLFNSRLESEPRRRRDVDFILLLGDAEAARLIRPVLSFHRAENMPVLSISRVYDDSTDAAANADINDLLFTEMPWFTDSGTMRELLAVTGDDAYARMHALGVDAWRLLPWLGALVRDGQAGLFGATGRLFVRQQRVVRELDWAVVRDGRLHLVGGRDPLKYLPRRVPDAPDISAN